MAIPIVIDNGSYMLRAGWCDADRPSLVFRNFVARTTVKSTGGPSSQKNFFGDAVRDWDVSSKWRIKQAFDRDVMVNFSVAEETLDYVLTSLLLERHARQRAGKPPLSLSCNGAVDHPVVLTEVLANPNICRRYSTEILFECYNVPSLAYGVDSLFSLHYNQRRHPGLGGMGPGPTALVVSSSHHRTSILPVIHGRLDATNAKRVDVGGCQSAEYLQSLLCLKYPQHRATFAMSRSLEYLKSYGRVAEDYAEEGSQWRSLGASERRQQSVLIQLPFSSAAAASAVASLGEATPAESGESQELKQQRKLERQQKFRDMIARKAVARDAAALADIEKRLQQGEKENAAAQMPPHAGAARQGSERKSEKRKPEADDGDDGKQSRKEACLDERAQDGVGIAAATVATATAKPLLLKDMDLSLVNVPDEELAPTQLREKRKQAMIKEVLDERERARVARQSKLKRDIDDKKQNPELWIASLRQERESIIRNKERRRKQKSELSDKRSAASKQRMRLIVQQTQAASAEIRGDVDESDTFGMDDEDWHVYFAMQKNAEDSASDQESSQLKEIEAKLRAIDPAFVEEEKERNAPQTVEEYFQIELGMETIRAPEIMFQPSLVGSDQAGLVETLLFVLKHYDAATQEQLVNNLFVTGGNSCYPGFAPRLTRELTAARPFRSSFRILSALDPVLDSWNGARLWGLDEAEAPTPFQGFLSRREYEELGSEYLKEHGCSNGYFPTPPPLAQEAGKPKKTATGMRPATSSGALAARGKGDSGKGEDDRGEDEDEDDDEYDEEAFLI